MFHDPRALLAIAAAAAPSLLAYNVSPSSTFLNQALALALWGGFVAWCAAGPVSVRWREPVAPLLVLALLAGTALWSWGPGGLPYSLALSALGLLAAAALLLVAGATQRAQADAVAVFALFCTGWAVAGALNVGVAVVQVFAPGGPDGDWIARSGIAGRAVGNLRQPNHLSSLLLWSAIAVVALLELRRLAPLWGRLLFAAFVFAVVLSASRTGLVSVGLLALWGLLDRRLSAPSRLLLLAAPLVYAASWFGMAAWAEASQHTFGGAARVAETDVSGSRFGIWANTLALIRAQPWAGVGFGEFNFAWTLTPFPGRPTAFFDHTHNLPLQLAVELGLPLASVLMALLLWSLWRAAAAAFGTAAHPGDAGTTQRAALLMVLMIALHSLLEYPLWYAYFLLPAAWAWGYALGPAAPTPHRSTPGPHPPSRVLLVGAITLVVGSALAVADYARVAAIFTTPRGAAPLHERIQAGQRSVLFAHHADYAAATAGSPAPDEVLQALTGAGHNLLDTRLMLAWANALAQSGQTEAARRLAQRLREFRNPLAAEFFAACEPLPAEPPFQCTPPQREGDWRDFLAR